MYIIFETSSTPVQNAFWFCDLQVNPMPSIREYYDVAVIGAGPAGLNAARSVLKSKEKASVLLVDKSKPWEKPIACAEAV